MILPVVAYGDPVLRKKGKEIDKEYPDLKELIENMKETMLHASGVGLAAPQVGHAIRLFIVDASPFADMEDVEEKEREELKDFKKIFINAKVIKEEGEKWIFNEGCLSVPNINEDVVRKEFITLEYQDENFNKHTKTFGGLPARIIQHEYDHTEGVIFTDKLSSLKKRLLKKKLENISKGKVEVSYRMRYPNIKF